jgi:pimeloyl-ACP methyl ester carboxylesterase
MATVAAQADAFVELLDALEIERAAVLGFSAGSTSCVQLALRHPERISHLVLVAANEPVSLAEQRRRHGQRGHRHEHVIGRLHRGAQ